MPSNKKWISERRGEHYYKKARKDGYASRAAYKMEQIQAKYHVIKDGDLVLDLCCAPGSWMEYILDSFPRSRVLGVDLSAMRVPTSERATFMKKNILDEDFIDVLAKLAGVSFPAFDFISSDCAPKFSGAKDVDLFRQHELSMRVVALAKQILNHGGNCVLKSFQGLPDDLEALEQEIKRTFSKMYRTKPSASRSRSAEFYYICKGKK